MQKILCVFFSLLAFVYVEGQESINATSICYEPLQKTTSINWLNYNIKCSGSDLISVSCQDSSLIYHVKEKKISVEDITITLKDDLIELHSLKNDTTVLLSISGIVNEQNNINGFIQLGHPVIVTAYNMGTLFMLSYYFAQNANHGTIYVMPYYGNPKNGLSWDIVLEIQAANNKNHQLKLLSNSLRQISSINFCTDNGLSIDYKKKENTGTAIFFSEGKTGYEISKMVKVKATASDKVFAYEDIIQYHKNGRIKKSAFPIPACK